MLHIYFHCLTNGSIFPTKCCSLSFSTFMTSRYLHSFESGIMIVSLQPLPLCLNCPENLFHLMPFQFCYSELEHPPSLTGNFLHPTWSKLRPSHGDFRTSNVPVSNFSLPMCRFCQLYRDSILLILQLSSYLSSSFTLDFFYSVGVNTKK